MNVGKWTEITRNSPSFEQSLFVGCKTTLCLMIQFFRSSLTSDCRGMDHVKSCITDSEMSFHYIKLVFKFLLKRSAFGQGQLFLSSGPGLNCHQSLQSWTAQIFGLLLRKWAEI